MNKSLGLSVALAAVLVCLSIDWIQAQKTAANSYQQQLGGSGSGQNSVYGGYSGGQSAASPVQQQRRTSGSSSRFSQQSIRQQGYQAPKQQPAPQRPAQPQPQPQQQQQQTSYSSSSSNNYESNSQAEADAEPASYGSVNGQPGTDFPSYSQVPKTSFSCEGVPYEYGMYADEETGCQAYHLCYNGRKDSFLCGTGTVFNQRILHCDYWYSVDCSKSSQYYSSNAYMGSSQPEPGPAQAGSNAAPVQQQQSYRGSSSQVSSSSVSRPASVGRAQAQQQSFSRNTAQQQEEVQEGY